MEIYEVGGAVRDRLLGRAIVDRDWVVVGATPEELIRLGFRQVGRDFPVFLHPRTQEEYALARTERKQGRGYHGFEFDTATNVTLEQDLARRDLTINAIAQDKHGKLIDPYGGQADLEKGILRHITSAFAEDPLRVLRVARFAARFDYRVAPETLELMRSLAISGELTTLTAERVWSELERALGEPHPARFIEVLHACGALSALFPELAYLFDGTQPDLRVHLLRRLRASAHHKTPTTVRFALLLYDFGATESPATLLPVQAEQQTPRRHLLEIFCARLKVPSAYRDLASLVARYHGKIHRVRALDLSALVDFLSDLDAFRRPARLEELLLACEIGTMQGRGDEDLISYPQGAWIRATVAVCRAVEMAPILAQCVDGPQVKAALRAARIEALRHNLKGDWTGSTRSD